MPEWLGNPDFHLSHRAKLLRKEPKFYKSVFLDADLDIDYIWPEPKHEFLPADPEDDFLWILRDADTEVDPEKLDTVALPPVRRANAAAAVPAADGYSPVYIDDGSRRPSKQPRKLPPKLVKKPTRKRQAQEEAFATLPGKTTVAVSFEDGRKFAVGQVLGRPITLDDGRFGRNFSVTEVIDRSAFDYPALLQDPRVFFPVPTPSVLGP
jgi:hypothetical protein